MKKEPKPSKKSLAEEYSKGEEGWQTGLQSSYRSFGNVSMLGRAVMGRRRACITHPNELLQSIEAENDA